MKRYSCLLMCLVLVFCLALPCPAETRETVIYREGEAETVQEKLYASGYGFSFWYADEYLEVYEGEEYTHDKDQGVAVIGPGSQMDINPVSRELAEDLLDEYDVSYDLDEPYAVIPLYEGQWLKDGGVFYDKMVAVNGQYVYVFAHYPLEQAEGIAKLFDRLLETISFSAGIPIRAEWGMDETEEEGSAHVNLRADKTVWNVYLLRLNWDEEDEFSCNTETVETWEKLEAGEELSVELEFIGMMPDNGIAYTDGEGVEHVYALDVSGEDGALYLWSLADYLK